MGLGKEVGRLVGQCMAGDGHGERVEVEGPLVKALGEVVTLSEGRAEDREGTGSGCGSGQH